MQAFLTLEEAQACVSATLPDVKTHQPTGVIVTAVHEGDASLPNQRHFVEFSAIDMVAVLIEVHGLCVCLCL
jgi:hypothetical protein